MGAPSLPGHTPAPWHLDAPSMGFGAVRGPQGELVFGLAAGCEGERQPEAVCEANARLIAAAPELLEALQLGLAARETAAKAIQRYGRMNDDSLAFTDAEMEAAGEAVIDAEFEVSRTDALARAVIAKATSQTKDEA